MLGRGINALLNLPRRKADTLFALFFVASSLLQFYLWRYSGFNLAPDEAHYWTWSKRPDLAYYSKGPLVAYLIARGTLFLGDTEIGVRAAGFFCSTTFFIIFYLFLREISLPGVALLGWLVLRTTVFYSTLGLVMTTDPPAAVLWLVALYMSFWALTKGRRFYWPLIGVAIGMGTLAKYTVFLLYPAICLAMLLYRPWRRELLRFNFILGGLLILVFLWPIYLWNDQHGWVNFAHNAGHLYKSSQLLQPKYFFDLLGGQLGLFGPLVVVGSLYGFYRGLKLFCCGGSSQEMPREMNGVGLGVVGLLAVPGILLTALCLLVSLNKQVYANWPFAIYINGILLVCYLYSQGELLAPRVKRFFVPAVGLSLLLVFVAHLPLFGITLGAPAKILPTKKLVGWSELGAKVEQTLVELKAQNIKPVIISDDYGTLSEISFYAPSHPEGYCVNIGGRRMNQYDIWGGWQYLKKRDALIVLKDPNAIKEMEARFADVTPISPQPNLQVSYLGETIREFYFFLGRDYDGYEPPLPEKR